MALATTSSHEILAKTGVNPDTRCKDLTEAEVSQLREVIDADYVVEGDLRREVAHEHQAAHGHRLLSWHCVIVAACRCVGSAPRRTRVPGAARAVRWLARSALAAKK